MIRKFDHGFLMNYLKPRGMMVLNLNYGPRTEDTICGKGNQIYVKDHPLLAPDILSWWTDE